MSLTLADARARAALVHDVATTVHLDLTSTEDYTVETVLEFSCRRDGADTFLELARGVDVEVEAPGDWSYDGRRITLTGLGTRNRVVVRARLPYVTDGDGMHTMTDPVDGERYVSSFTGMDVAQKVLACFDQPDLKSTFAVTVTAPGHWTVLANGAFVARDGDTWSFTTTPPIASYLFFVTGGPWTSHTWQEPYAHAPGGQLDFGWHARASQRAELDRDIAHLRELTSACFAHYTATFDEPYPFADYQQVFSPGLNWGAMEFPGVVSFRDEMLTPGAPTALEEHWRSSVVAHEMAHMWFGDLVTMVWWEDSWLNESFADYMGYEVAGLVTGADSWTAAALERKPTAYWADRRRSTHPVAEDAENLVDVDTAFANFDMITYAKGGAVLRQLVTWLGTEDFNRGVNAHLSAHPFGNATLADFLDALDAATDRDVRGWAEAWLRTTGYDRIVVTREGDVPVLTRHGRRPHRFTVAAFDASRHEVGRVLVDVADEPVALPQFAGLAVLPNADDETYAEVELDPLSVAAFTAGLGQVLAPRTRAVLWASFAAATEYGRLPLADLVELATVHLAHEDDATVLEGALTLVRRMLRRCATDEEVPPLQDQLAALGRRVLARSAEHPTLVPGASRLLAGSSHDRDELQAWLDGSALPAPDQSVRWRIVQRLAELGEAGPTAVEADRDPSNAGALEVLTARASLPTREAKEWAWGRLLSGELGNREFTAVAAGMWAVEQGDLVAGYATQTPAAFTTLARESGQGMGQVIGRGWPWLPLPEAARAGLRDELARVLAEPDVPTVLGRYLADHLDDLDVVLAR